MLATLLPMAFGLVTLPITAHSLGPEGRGLLTGAIAWVSGFSTLLIFGLGQVAVFQLAKGSRAEPYPRILGSILLLWLATTVLGWFLAAVLHASTAGRAFGEIPTGVIALAFAMLPFLTWISHGQYLLGAVGAYPKFAAAGIIASFLNLGGILVLLLVKQLSVISVMAMSLLSNALFAIPVLAWCLQHAKWRISVSKPLVLAFVSAGSILAINTMGTYVFSTSDILLLNYLRSPAEVGYYQLAVTLIGLSTVLPQGLSMAFYATGASLGPENSWTMQRKIVRWVFGILPVGLLIAFATAPLVIRTLAGQDFMPALTPLRILLLAVPGMTASYLMTPQWIARGRFRTATMITLVPAVLNLGLNLYAIPRWGIEGAAWTTVLAYAVVLAWQAHGYRKFSGPGTTPIVAPTTDVQRIADPLDGPA
jgi:O-antigen/teichoic acid export membrane protein